MRQLYLMRGNIGSGKSTWLQRMGLEQFTLCADTIRLMVQSPVLTVDGGFAIGQENDRKVWQLLFDMLEARMVRGELVFIDAVHSKSTDFAKYKRLCEQYRYRIFCVDLSDVPLEVCSQQNASRPLYKIVPQSALENIDARFKTQPLPNYVTRRTPADFSANFQIIPIELDSTYEAVEVIGDIHGCANTLENYFTLRPYRENVYYVFVGDYIDRGPDSVGTLRFLTRLLEGRSNILLLEGNHERWLRLWANNDIASIKSNEFLFKTMKQLTESDITQSDMRQFTRKLAQMAYLKFKDRYILVTHAGISRLPENLAYVATDQFIKGVGKYEDMEKVAESWYKNSYQNAIQVCGHRNVTSSPIKVNDKFFNLEGKVEFGGSLRGVHIKDFGIPITEIEIPNNAYRPNVVVPETVPINSPALVAELRSNRGVKEKSFGSISSFSFTRTVFADRNWDRTNVKARGLFINTATNEIVARSYNKFFNIGERQETRIENLKLRFPVAKYMKYNGFLGLIGYDSLSDELLFTSKSSLDGPYVDFFKNVFGRVCPHVDLVKLKDYLKANNVTLVFEVIDPVNDPHIIEHANEAVILLDVVERTFDYKKKSYDELVKFGKDFGFTVKERVAVIDDFKTFMQMYENDLKDSIQVEGYVFEDADGFMVKLKTPYYEFWKGMRGLKDAVKRRHTVKTSGLITPEANYFWEWAKKQTEATLEKDIITLRKMFKSSQHEVNVTTSST